MSETGGSTITECHDKGQGVSVLSTLVMLTSNKLEVCNMQITMFYMSSQ